LTYWQSKPDGGQYAAIDEGFKKTTGEIMTWLNSDDKFNPNSFVLAASIFLNRKDTDWITGRTSTFFEQEQKSLMSHVLQRWSREGYIKRQYSNPFIQQEGTFWRRSLWETSGAKLSMDFDLAGDCELWVRFFRYAQLYSVDAPLGEFRFQPDQKTALFMERYHKEAQEIFDHEIDLLNKGAGNELLPAPEPITIKEIKELLYSDSSLESSNICEINKKGEDLFSEGDASLNGARTEKYLVSAIVSTYNAERFIRGRLQNLIDQTLYKKNQLEVIVIDSNSPQNERKVVEEFMVDNNNIVYERTSERETVYGAWNRGIKLAGGKYVINANTDDRFAIDALERMANELSSNPDISAVYGDWLITKVENDTFDSDTKKTVYHYPEFFPPLFFYGQITTHAALLRKRVRLPLMRHYYARGFMKRSAFMMRASKFVVTESSCLDFLFMG